MTEVGYFKVENIVIDGYSSYDKELDQVVHKDLFECIHEKMIYMILERYANNNDGIAFPSISTIAKSAMCGVTTVKKYLKKLVDKGYITKTLRPKSNGDNDSNIYTVKNLSEICKDIFLPQSSSDPGTSPDDHYKEQYIKNSDIKDHDNTTVAQKNSASVVSSDPDSFKNFFKNIEVGYTTKNKNSVKALLKKMKPQQVMQYLKETWENIKITPGVINAPALFSIKIERQERQMTATARQTIIEKEKAIEKQKQLENKIDCADPMALFNSLPPVERLRVEKQAVNLFINQSGADEKILNIMRDNNPTMYLNTIKLQLKMALKL
ncbi:MAG: helix-turn-helix domain-containing protein [Fusobacterium sp.]|uniref:helix-turn-helix domain-containing protein n=1 Tax=Fusobacterium sp. TaxID=68766 RepID=UPI002A7637AD|nr:helix-turn-helix domain-containing protein [Fusobacterium sp.]MDY3059835.1 helix-turn-helix domain-containing protein [Fusobacterium sp.]